MKKLAVILIFVAGAAFLSTFFFLRKTEDGSGTAPQHLPAGTSVYAAFPNLEALQTRWKDSALARMSSDPEIRPFLRQPARAILNEPAFQEASKLLEALKLRSVFFALTKTDINAPGVLIGFRHDGEVAAVREAFSKLHNVLAENAPPQLESSLDRGLEIVKQNVDSQVVFTASGKGWGIVGNDIPALEHFLASLEGTATTPALSDTQKFRQVRDSLATEPDFLSFLDMEQVVQAIKSFAEAQGEEVIPNQFAELETLKSAGFCVSLEKAGVRERQVAFGNWNLPSEKMNNKGIAYAPEKTLFYLASVWNPKDLASSSLLSSIPPVFLQSMEEADLSLEALTETIAEEYSFFAWWPNNALVPGVAAAVQLDDPETAKVLFRKAAGIIAGEAVVEEDSELTMVTFPNASLGMVSPALGFVDNMVFATANATDLPTLVAAKRSGENFLTTPLGKSVSARASEPDTLQTMVFDLPGLVERAYITVQPLLPFATAMSPGLVNFVELEKLPPVQAIARHLSPVTARQMTIPGGIRSEIEGSLTFSPALLGVAAGARDGFADVKQLAE